MNTTNQRPNLDQMAKQLVGKSEAEILAILKNKFPEREAQNHTARATITNARSIHKTQTGYELSPHTTTTIQARTNP